MQLPEENGTYHKLTNAHVVSEKLDRHLARFFIPVAGSNFSSKSHSDKTWHKSMADLEGCRASSPSLGDGLIGLCDKGTVLWRHHRQFMSSNT